MTLIEFIFPVAVVGMVMLQCITLFELRNLASHAGGAGQSAATVDQGGA